MQLNFCKMLSILIFNALMTFSHLELGRTVIFLKYLASIATLICLPKTLIWNKTTFLASNSLNLAALVVNKLMRIISIRIIKIPFSIRFITV